MFLKSSVAVWQGRDCFPEARRPYYDRTRRCWDRLCRRSRLIRSSSRRGQSSLS